MDANDQKISLLTNVLPEVPHKTIEECLAKYHGNADVVFEVLSTRPPSRKSCPSTQKQTSLSSFLPSLKQPPPKPPPSLQKKEEGKVPETQPTKNLVWTSKGQFLSTLKGPTIRPVAQKHIPQSTLTQSRKKAFVQTITLQELQKSVPLTLYENFLPDELSNDVLKLVLSIAPKMKKPVWKVFNTISFGPRFNCTVRFEGFDDVKTEEDESDAFESDQSLSEHTKGDFNRKRVREMVTNEKTEEETGDNKQQEEEEDEARKKRRRFEEEKDFDEKKEQNEKILNSTKEKLVETKKIEDASAYSTGHSIGALIAKEEALLQAKALVDSFVSQEFQNRKCGDKWESNFVLCNVYPTGEHNVGLHSDQLSYLGPRPAIASLSLGAARLFVLKPAADQEEKSWYSVRLPHNSLAIMWPPCQEEWKHEITKEKTFPGHPLSGEARVNLTFRMRRKSLVQNTPKCKCGVNCLLRPARKSSANLRKYFWVCGYSAVREGCAHFEWFEEPKDWKSLFEETNFI